MNLNKDNNNVLEQAKTLLIEPSKNTKRRILLSVNGTLIFAIVLHLALQLITTGGLPDPQRDIIIFPLILVINSLSFIYNYRVLKGSIKGTNKLKNLTAWASIIILQLLSITIVHTNINTATSILFDFSLSFITLFISGIALNRKVAVVWFIIATASLIFGHQNRGADFEYDFLTKTEIKEFKEKLANGDKDALKRLETLKQEKLVPLPVNLFMTVGIIFLILTFLATYFQAGMIGNVLGVIPNVVNKIQIASDQKNELEQENMRMGAELDVAQRIQMMVLPKKEEYNDLNDLDIAASMTPATEVGGDFYDILPQENGTIFFGIGDVTDHGLQSGIVMLMTQSAFRTSIQQSNFSLQKALIDINSVLFENIQTRLNDQRNLTLSLFEYKNSKVKVVGQHETILHYKAKTNELIEIDTSDLGLYVGLVDEFEEFVDELEIDIEEGDTLFLYTDGIPEAENIEGEFYGMERMQKVITQNITKSPEEINQLITSDVHTFLNGVALQDDITLVIIRKK